MKTSDIFKQIQKTNPEETIESALKEFELKISKQFTILKWMMAFALAGILLLLMK